LVRIWRLPVWILDRQHLLGEHNELHTIVSVILRGGGGWWNHPQTNRFKGRLGLLVDRHRQQVEEMERRGYNHRSPLPKFDYKPERYVLGVAYTREEMLADLNLLIERKGVIEERVRDVLDLIGVSRP